MVLGGREDGWIAWRDGLVGGEEGGMGETLKEGKADREWVVRIEPGTLLSARYSPLLPSALSCLSVCSVCLPLCVCLPVCLSAA
jgi:hypothetical protein